VRTAAPGSPHAETERMPRITMKRKTMVFIVGESGEVAEKVKEASGEMYGGFFVSTRTRAAVGVDERATGAGRVGTGCPHDGLGQDVPATIAP